MAKNFTIPTLVDATRQYLELLQQPARQKDFDKAEAAFQKALQRVRRVEEVRNALKLDKRRQLPVQLKSPAYERMLSIAGRTPELLREYAQEMYDFGPEFTHYADTLWDEAKRLDP